MKPAIRLNVERTMATAYDLAACYGSWTMKAGGQEMAGKGIERARPESL